MGCSICPKEKQRIRSKALSYFYAFVKELKRAKKIKGSILLDGEERVEFQHILFLSIHNHPYESGYALGCGASGEDGVLDWSAPRKSFDCFTLCLRHFSESIKAFPECIATGLRRWKFIWNRKWPSMWMENLWENKRIS